MANQIKIPEEYILTSTTDLNGTITSVSEDFLAICGYTEDEMVGQPHNMIRHPDNPKELFADLWATVSKGRAWTGVVRNNSKNGDYYWVKANVSANYKGGSIVGYTSVRVAATSEEIVEAEDAYTKIRNGELAINHGFIQKPLFWKLQKLNVFNLISIKATALILMFSIFFAALGTLVTTSLLQDQLAEVKVEWNYFQDIGSQKAQSVNKLLGYMGYGGMIHTFKNYLLRKDDNSHDQIQEKISLSLAELESYKMLGLNEKEAKAYEDIKKTINNYKMAMYNAHVLEETGLMAQGVDERIKISDRMALEGLEVFKKVINEARNTKGLYKAETFNKIRSELGYGGMIHQFKNYVLRAEEGRIKKVTEKITLVEGHINAYRGFPLSEPEKQALDALSKMLNNYKASLSKAVGLVAEGLIPEEIDKQVKVSDSEALNALTVLGEEIQRNAVIKSEAVTKLLGLSALEAKTNFIMVLIITPFILAIFYWALFTKIIHPIHRFRKAILNIEETSRFDLRCSTSVFDDEISQTTGAFDNLFGKIQMAMASVNTVMRSVGSGDFNSRVNDELSGDLGALKIAVNQSAESVSFTMQELTKIMAAIESGDFAVKLDSRVKGEFSLAVDRAMSSINENISSIASVMVKLESGDFSARVEADAKGELLMLKDSVNGSMAVLHSAFADINKVVSALASGDMSQKINTQYQGEFLSATQSVNTTVDKLNEVVSTVVQSANEITDAAAHVKQNSDGLAQKAEEQSDSLQHTTDATEKMTQSVGDTVSITNQVNNQVTKSYEEAQKSDQIVQQTITSMEAINESSSKISEIISVIDSIAFQTNLLALNAAVEAARAGEHGRGFAVVAGEVRNLAGKSANAAKDIKELIEDSISKVEDGSRYVSNTSDALSHLSDSITEVRTSVEDISEANLVQKTGINNVNTTVGDLKAITTENIRITRDSQVTIEQINALSQKLNKLVSFFKS